MHMCILNGWDPISTVLFDWLPICVNKLILVLLLAVDVLCDSSSTETEGCLVRGDKI